jgi:CRISPR/Cas system-associated endonuclease Cas1
MREPVSWRDYVDSRIAELHAQRISDNEAARELRAADNQAVKVALASYEKRMDTTNEWREALRDQQETYITKGQMAWAITAFFLALGTGVAIYVAVGAVQ